MSRCGFRQFEVSVRELMWQAKIDDDDLELLSIAARLQGALQVAEELLKEPLVDEKSMDLRHLVLILATELLQVDPKAYCLAQRICEQMSGRSPLLLADSLRYLRHLAPQVSSDDAVQLFHITMKALQELHSDPEVREEGLEVLSKLSRCPKTSKLFMSYFSHVWQADLPLQLITSFCRSMLEAFTQASQLRELETRPLKGLSFRRHHSNIVLYTSILFFNEI